MNLMACLLYVVTRKFHFGLEFEFLKFEVKYNLMKFFEQAYLVQDVFKSQFIDFLNSLCLINLSMDDGIIRYLYPFLTL